MSKKYAVNWREAIHSPSGFIPTCRHAVRNMLLSTLAAADQALEGTFLRCVYCHYVFDDQVEEFERILVSLKQYGQFINTDTCVQMARGKKPIDGRFFHLSFDDGFRNNLTNALPVLQKHHIPCIFFVPSGLIEGDYESTRQYCLETMDYKGVIETLRWRDVEAILSAGYEIGSHTRMHARFSVISCDEKQMRHEFLGSKNDLEQRLGVECKYISWPFGRVSDADSASLSMVEKIGYRACFGAFRGSVVSGKTDLFRIPRHHFEAQWPISHVRYFARGHMEE